MSSQMTCSLCGHTKNVAEFLRPGQSRWCKRCASDRDKRYRQKRLSNPELLERERERCRIKAAKERARRTPEEVEKDNAAKRARLREKWANDAEYRERCRVRKRAKYNADAAYREAVQSRNRKYDTSPRGMDSRRNREAARKRNGGSLTVEEWWWVLMLQGMQCAKCGVEFSDNVPPARDHIVSVARGGSLDIDNCQALCKSCNSSKRDRCDDYRDQAHRSVVEEYVAGVPHWFDLSVYQESYRELVEVWTVSPSAVVQV